MTAEPEQPDFVPVAEKIEPTSDAECDACLDPQWKPAVHVRIGWNDAYICRACAAALRDSLVEATK